MNLTKNYYTSNNYTGLTDMPLKKEFSRFINSPVFVTKGLTDV